MSLDDPLLVPHDGFVGGQVAPPPSKSYSHRALNLALLAAAPRRVESLLEAEDTELFRRALRDLGWLVAENASRRSSAALDVDLQPPGNRSSEGAAKDRIHIHCGNAGTMFRFLTASLAVVPGDFVLDGSARLRERPIRPLVEALRDLGAKIEYLEREGFAPMAISGGSLRGGECRLDAGESSQYLSALLMAGCFTPQPVRIVVDALTSAPYVEVTLDAMSRFGLTAFERRDDGFLVRPAHANVKTFVVEADDSAVPYSVAASMISGRPVELIGLRRDSVQGDRRFLDVLSRMGARLQWSADGKLHVDGSVLRSVEVEMGSMPDQVPTLAAVATFAPGETIVREAAHLRLKESDRLEAMATELSRAGVVVHETEDGLRVIGDESRKRAWKAERVEIDPRSDHRIAMSLALVGLRRPNLYVRDPETVGKSYPQFWQQIFGMV